MGDSGSRSPVRLAYTELIDATEGGTQLKRIVTAIVLLLFLLLIVELLAALFLGPPVVEDNQGVWHIIEISVIYLAHV